MPGLPERIVQPSELEDRRPDELASSTDGSHLDVEAAERDPVAVGRYGVTAPDSEGWSMPVATTVLLTNRRLAWLTTAFDQGGGWVGSGAVGLIVSSTASVISKQHAAQRSASKVAVGQVRHGWVTAFRLRRRKTLIGLVDTYGDLELTTAQRRGAGELWGKGWRTSRWVLPGDTETLAACALRARAAEATLP